MANPVHRDEARRVIYGVATLALLILVGFVGAVVQTGGALPGRSYTYAHASFEDVGILKTGKEVRHNGVPVGMVSAIEYVDGKADVTLRLNGDRPVYKDAVASVGNVSALGKKYVDLDPGTPAAGELGDGVIPASQTNDSTSLEDVLGVLDPRTRAALQSTLGELGTGIGGHSQDLNDVLHVAPYLLDDLEQLTGAAAGTDADLSGLLSSADTLVSRFEGRESEIAGLLVNTDRTMSGLGVDDGRPLQDTIKALPASLDEARRALDVLHDPLVNARSALHTIGPGGRALGASTRDLRSFLRGSTRPLDKVPAIGEQATPAVEDLTRTVSDARPLVRPASLAVGSLATLLHPFAPYAGDAGRFFSQHDLLSGTLGSDDKHYFAALLTGPGIFSVNGLWDPLYRSEPYPVPGTAWNHSTITDSRTSGGAR